MSAKGTRAELLQHLQKLGVETVTAEYNGSGDEGQIETPEFEPVEVPHDVVMAVENLFYGILGELYGGWEINEGSFGQIVWDVREDRINLVYNGRIESVHTEVRTL
jgi:hypothetical protein